MSIKVHSSAVVESEAELGEGVDREAVRARLFNQRLSSYADSFLAELKADAIILSQ